LPPGHTNLFFKESIVQQQEVILRSEFIELNQLLKVAGVCDSGGAGKTIVASGQVRVDGRVELRKTCKIRAGQVVAVGDVRIRTVAEDAAAPEE
jgi:ribosome-associated protein